MSLFRDILGKIFPAGHPALQDSVPASASDAAGAPAVPPQGPQAPVGADPGTPASPGPADAVEAGSVAPSVQVADAPPARGVAGASAAPVDVGAVLAAMAARHPEPLNYRSSIVDLLKLLDLDSSLPARQALAHELGYAGDPDDSAAMNVWLHRQVMARLAENGGRVPEDLRG